MNLLRKLFQHWNLDPPIGSPKSQTHNFRHPTSDKAEPMTSFPYKQLNVSKKEIRLLLLDEGSNELRGKLVRVSLKEKPNFEALSYTWGQPPFEHSIEINGQEFPIGANLHAALTELRKYDTARTLWIDAICINQNDELERRQQIGIMQEIFISASQVRAWLGEGDENSEKAMSLLENLQEEDLERFRAAEFKCPEWLALNSFWRRPYWRRIWIIQELAVADGRALLGCGSRWIQRSAFQNALEILAAHRNNPDTLLWEAIDSDMDWLLNLSQICRCDVHSWGEEHLQRLEYLLYLTEQFEATVPHDHFFALLGLSQENDRSAIPVDYTKCFADICTQTVDYIIHSTQSLNILSGNRSLESNSLSSWMPSFSDRVRRGYGWNSFRIFRASGDKSACVTTSPCGRVLSCKGIEIGRVNFVEGPFENLKSDFHNAQTILRMREKAREALRTMNTNAGTDMIFWETLIANIAATENVSTSLARAIQHFDGLENHVANADQAEQLVKPFVSHFVATLRFRCFFTTSNGHIGVGPWGVKEDDLAVVLFGADVPFILRSHSSTAQYGLVGDAFVHGVMNGEIIAESTPNQSAECNHRIFKLK
jgi:Heterokaryon incompatibility protein (HET)